MQLQITINLDNAAFGEDDADECGVEVARILRKYADSCADRGCGYKKLRDINGNPVGHAALL